MKGSVRVLTLAVLAGFLAASVVSVSARGPAPPPHAAVPYEVWALDQGTNTLYVINHNLKVTKGVQLGDNMTLPHMVDFTSDGAFAAIANPTSGDTAIMRATGPQVLAVLPTGPGSHMAAILPDDSAIITAVIGDGTMVEIVPDWQRREFRIGRTLKVADDPLFMDRADEFPGSSPVCHAYTQDGRFAYITLGPALANGGVVVMDTETFELVAVFPPAQVSANCGTAPSPDGSKMYVNGGSLEEGHWYVFDTSTHQLLSGPHSSRGLDAHGLAFTPDGSELWMVNRATSNAIIVDPLSNEVIEEIDFIGSSPDIIAVAPDGAYAFITLRGPNPLTGPHAIAGETPGIAVVDVATREIVTIIEPDQGNENSDFHGIGIRTRPR